MFDWQSFLSTQSAIQASDEADAECIILADYSLIVIEGPDAIKFLQGQCTCDFDLISQNQITPGAHCNHKGRMHSSFYAASLARDTNTTDTAYRVGLRVHNSIVDAAYTALKKYIVFSKAEISIRHDYAIVGLCGNQIIQALEKLNLSPPEKKYFSIQNQITTLLHDEDLVELWICDTDLKKLWPALSSLTPSSNSTQWNLLNIRKGIAELQAPLVETLIPQEMNMQYTGGVSFQKGCYTGQEVIARMHYRGNLKKHMYLGSISTGTKPDIGTELFVGNKKCGVIINSAKSSEEEYNILALCNDTAYTDDNVSLNENSTSIIQWLPLPYAIT